MIVHANDGISSTGIKSLEEKGFKVLLDRVSQENLVDFINEQKVEVLLVRSATKVRQDLIDATNLKIVGRGGVGMDNIDVDYAKSKGVNVINTPAASSASVAELVFAHMLSLSRYLHDANRKMPLEGDSKFKELKKSYSRANELRGKTMGVIGFGRIGEETVRLAIGMGMKLKVYDPFIKEKKIHLSFFDGQTIDFDIETCSLEDLFSNSDYISVHVPAQENYVIGKEEISKLKDGAIVINAARGGVVDEKAIVDAIESKKIRGAALDVFENEPKPEIALLMNPSLSLSPHVGGSTIEAQDRIGEELADQIISFYGK